MEPTFFTDFFSLSDSKNSIGAIVLVKALIRKQELRKEHNNLEADSWANKGLIYTKDLTKTSNNMKGEV